MRNNFELIKPLLDFPNKDCFYFLQILQRKKDNPELGNNSRLIKAYYIDSVDKLEAYKDEIVKLSDVFNARASINLNPRNAQKAAFQVMQKIADQMGNGDWAAVRKAYESVCGHYHSETDKRWLVDIDHYDDIHNMNSIVDYITNQYSKQQKKDYRILATIPTKSGFHIICNPFNLEYWSENFPRIEIHKNNPTLLYMPGEAKLKTWIDECKDAGPDCGCGANGTCKYNKDVISRA